MYDRAMQSLYALAVEPIAEATGDRTSFGFKKFKHIKISSKSLYTPRIISYWIIE